MAYVHGCSERETRRLHEQSLILEDLDPGDTGLQGSVGRPGPVAANAGS
jgi:hypothetical protein